MNRGGDGGQRWEGCVYVVIHKRKFRIEVPVY